MNLQRSHAQLTDEQHGRTMQLQNLQNDLTDKQEILEEKRSLLHDMQDEQERIQLQIKDTQAQAEALRITLANDTRVLDARRNEYDLLKSLVDSMEGYPESVKFLHNNKNWNHESPILSDVIYVAEEYRAAIENLLEPYLNYYIVSSPQEALTAIHLLEEHKKGKANFFILDHLNGVGKQPGNQPPTPQLHLM